MLKTRIGQKVHYKQYQQLNAFLVVKWSQINPALLSECLLFCNYSEAAQRGRVQASGPNLFSIPTARGVVGRLSDVGSFLLSDWATEAF